MIWSVLGYNLIDWNLFLPLCVPPCKVEMLQGSSWVQCVPKKPQHQRFTQDHLTNSGKTGILGMNSVDFTQTHVYILLTRKHQKRDRNFVKTQLLRKILPFVQSLAIVEASIHS